MRRWSILVTEQVSVEDAIYYSLQLCPEFPSKHPGLISISKSLHLTWIQQHRVWHSSKSLSLVVWINAVDCK